MSSQHNEREQPGGVLPMHADSTLPKHAEVSDVGYLAEALHDPDGEVVVKAESALIKLLPRLNAGDAGLLSIEQRECLYGVMQIGNISGKSDFIAAALDALARIGDVRALPTVVALASCHVDSSACRRVKTAAENCLQALREIETLNDPDQMLLRASEAALGSTDTLLRPIMGDTGSPDTLVRPVIGQTDEHPEQLLRLETNAVKQSPKQS
jgi:hypothetical protein